MRGVLDRVVPARLGPGFRWLLASSWTTNLGDGIFVAAGPLLVASLTANPLLIALAALLRWAPPLLFGLYAGVLSDRLDRRRIVLVANAIRALVLVGLVVLLVTGRLTAATALGGLALLATAEVFVDNSTATLTPMLVDRDALALANARVMFGFVTINQLAGPAVGAVLFAVGAAWPVAATAPPGSTGSCWRRSWTAGCGPANDCHRPASWPGGSTSPATRSRSPTSG